MPPDPIVVPSHGQAGPLANFGFSTQWPCHAPLADRSRTMVQLASESDVRLDYVGTMPLFKNHIVAPGKGRDWVLVALADDPLFVHPKGFPIPRRAKRDLERVQSVGLDFDTIYIAHEVLPGAVKSDQLLTYDALKPPPPRSAQKLSHGLGSMATMTWSIGLAPLVATPLVLGAAALASLPALLALDPIVLGVVTAGTHEPREGDESAFFHLTHWDYGVE